MCALVAHNKQISELIYHIINIIYVHYIKEETMCVLWAVAEDVRERDDTAVKFL